jgi:hypothetical protein
MLFGVLLFFVQKLQVDSTRKIVYVCSRQGLPKNQNRCSITLEKKAYITVVFFFLLDNRFK